MQINELLSPLKGYLPLVIRLKVVAKFADDSLGKGLIIANVESTMNELNQTHTLIPGAIQKFIG